MNKKQRKTLEQIFEKPTRSNIEWQAVESLLIALGAEISEGSGSRVRIALKDWRGVYHRPHPQKEMVKGAVDQLRKDLLKIGVKPDEL
ncbi:MAG: type II toxin-antitoxin system HicA family toxin [Victivallaceae bacterium]